MLYCVLDFGKGSVILYCLGGFENRQSNVIFCGGVWESVRNDILGVGGW
jgi:hypothetical protein